MDLDDLYAAEDFRTQQVGCLLSDAVIEVALAPKCKKTGRQVSSWNENAIGFYTKLGATIGNTELRCHLELASN